MENGRVVEAGPLADLVTRPGSRLARDMFPLGPAGEHDGRTLIEITFRGAETARPFIATLARAYDVDANILGASVETIAGRQVGRMRLALPGPYEDNAAPIGFLRSQGLRVDVLREEDTAAPAAGRTAAGAAGKTEIAP
jgi:D-methionine transport system ATP-binding protein